MPGSIEAQLPCFVVRDSDGRRSPMSFTRKKPGRRSAAKLLTKDEARRIEQTLRSCRRICARIRFRVKLGIFFLQLVSSGSVCTGSYQASLRRRMISRVRRRLLQNLTRMGSADYSAQVGLFFSHAFAPRS